jgi:hypothetical protein
MVFLILDCRLLRQFEQSSRVTIAEFRFNKPYKPLLIFDCRLTIFDCRCKKKSKNQKSLLDNLQSSTLLWSP